MSKLTLPEKVSYALNAKHDSLSHLMTVLEDMAGNEDKFISKSDFSESLKAVSQKLKEHSEITSTDYEKHDNQSLMMLQYLTEVVRQTKDISITKTAIDQIADHAETHLQPGLNALSFVAQHTTESIDRQKLVLDSIASLHKYDPELAIRTLTDLSIDKAKDPETKIAAGNATIQLAGALYKNDQVLAMSHLNDLVHSDSVAVSISAKQAMNSLEKTGQLESVERKPTMALVVFKKEEETPLFKILHGGDFGNVAGGGRSGGK